MKRSVFTVLIALLFSASLFAQLSGPKNIPGDYATVAAAISALNAQGVGAGGVTFNIDANYTETFASSATGIITATGTAANPVVFQKSGTGNNPVITAGVGTSVGTGSNAQDGIIVISGGDYITFDGINLIENALNLDPTTKMEVGYALVKASKLAPVNGCQYVTIKNCTVTLSKYTVTTNTTTGIYSGNHIATENVNITFTESSDAVNNCKFFGITVSNVSYGMRILGGNVAVNIYDQNNEIGVEGPINVTDFNYYAINARYQRNLKVANSVIFTNALPVSGLYGLHIQNTYGCDVYNNTVTFQPSGGNFAQNGISIYAGETGNTGNIYNNIVQNCTNIATTNQAFTGISNSGPAGTLNFYSNQVINNSFPGTGGFTGMQSGSVENLNMYDNVVSNNTKTGNSGSFTCLSVNASKVGNVHHNQVFTNNNNTTATANQSGAMWGITSSNGNPTSIYNNLIYDLTNNGGGVNYDLMGIQISSGTLINVYNNYVYDLKGPLANPNVNPTVNPKKNLIAGINNSTSPTAINIYFNTVFLMASSTGMNFSTAAINAANGPKIDMRNNILVNLSSPQGEGVTVAFRRTSTDLSNYLLTSNYNCLFGGIAEDEYNTTYFDGTNYYDFAAYQTWVGPVRETGSFRELPPFTSIGAPMDLHLLDYVPTSCESGGVQISNPAITTDYDGNTRSAAPDLGADEFGGIAIGIVNPGAVAATPISSHQIDLGFVPNAANNDVVVVWNNTGAFITPSGTPPAIGDAFAGGTVLYTGITAPASHTNLVGASSYYYKAFSFDGTNYSSGVGVFASTNIAPPTAFTALAFSPTQINLTWNKNAFNNDVIVAYKKNDATAFGTPVNGTAYSVNNVIPGGGIVAYVGPASAFNHTGLDPNVTNYYYQAWSVDPTNNTIYSPTAVNANAATLCSSVTIPFYESFEYGGTLGCGTTLDVNANANTWYPAFNFPRQGQYSLRINGGMGATHNDWYFTNALELTAGSTYEVKFWYRTQNLSNPPHKIEVKWGNAPTVAGMTSSPIFYNATMPTTTTYTQITCTLFTPTTTGLYHVGWHDFTDGLPAGHYLVMDEITITKYPVDPPVAFVAAADLNKINLNYTKNAANEDVIIATNLSNIFDQPVNGTVYQPGNLIGANGTVLYKGSLSAFTHTNLLPSTQYFYKIWSVSAQNWYSLSGLTANATTSEYHHICMPAGWGGLSSYMTPDVAALETVFADVVDDMQILLSNTGIFWPSQNINTIGNWNTYEGYKIKMNQPVCLDIFGIDSENNTFTVKAGSSFIPVLCDQPVDAIDFFSQFGNDLVFAYDFYSQQMYWPAGGIYTLGNLEPGVGYLVKMNAQRQATYLCGKSGQINYVKAEPIMYQNAPWSVNTTGTQHFISIEKSALAGIEKGDFIGVFNSRGECAGFTQFTGQSSNLMIVANGDDITTGTIEGFAQGEEMTVKVYSPSRNSEVTVQVSYKETMPNAGLYAELGQSVIYKMSGGATYVSENLTENISIHPNPGTGMFYLQVPAMDQELNVQVENGTGQVVYTEKIDGNHAGANYPLNLSDVKAGVYFVRITGANQSVVRKLIVK